MVKLISIAWELFVVASLLLSTIIIIFCAASITLCATGYQECSVTFNKVE